MSREFITFMRLVIFPFILAVLIVVGWHITDMWQGLAILFTCSTVFQVIEDIGRISGRLTSSYLKD